MIIKTSDLVEAAGIISKWIPSKPIIEQSGWFLLSPIADDKISITATDVSSGEVIVFLDVQGNSLEEQIAVAAKQFSGIAGSISKVGQEINIDVADKKLVVSCGQYNASLVLMDVGEFPYVHQCEDGAERYSIDADKMKRVVTIARGIVDPNNPRTILSGVFFDGENAAMADGVRMAVIRNMKISEEPIIIPAEFLFKTEPVFSSTDIVSFVLDDDRLYMLWDGGVASTSVLPGKYPQYKMMIPEKYETRFSLPQKDMENAIRLAAIYAVDEYNLVIVNATGSTGVHFESIAQIGRGGGRVDTSLFEGADITFGVSYKYLSDAIAKVESPRFGLNGSNKIVILENDDMLYGIMPLRVES